MRSHRYCDKDQRSLTKYCFEAQDELDSAMVPRVSKQNLNSMLVNIEFMQDRSWLTYQWKGRA